MSELGDNQVYSSSAKPGFFDKAKQKGNEVLSNPKVEHVRQKIENRLKQNTSMDVEQKWMNAYQRTVDTLDPGMRKKVAEKLRPVAWAVSKTARIGSAVTDFVLKWGGGLDILRSVPSIVRPGTIISGAQNALDGIDFADMPAYVSEKLKLRMEKTLNKAANMTEKQMRVEGLKQVGKGFVENWMGRKRISRVAAGWLADVAGAGGERVAQISNKIFSGKPKPGPVMG